MDWSIVLHDRICICFACCCRANTTAAWFITIFLTCDLCRQYMTLRILSQYHFAMSPDEAIKSAKSLSVAKLQNVPLWWFAAWGGETCDQPTFNVTNGRFAQSPSRFGLPIPNIFCGLVTRWIPEINPNYLENFLPSSQINNNLPCRGWRIRRENSFNCRGFLFFFTPHCPGRIPHPPHQKKKKNSIRGI